MKVEHTLHVERRERVGSRYAKRERTAGKLPAVLYGHGQNPVALTLNAKEAVKLFQQGERVFNIDLAGEGKQAVLLKDIQFDYLGTNLIHVDLARVDMNEVIDAHVQIRFVGEAPGLKRAGAIFTHPMPSLHIRCTVADLPDHVDVSVESLDLGGIIHAREVVLPKGITLAGDPDGIVAQISEAGTEVATGEAAAVEGTGAEPEVIVKKKEEKKDE
jgi:large subunit ribosomal protein L25